MPEPSLGRVVGVLRARWRLVLLLAVPVLLLSFWYAASRPPEYRSEVVLTFTPGPSGRPDNSFVRLLPRYLLAATGDSTLRTAEAAAGLPVGALGDSVTAENPTGSLQIELTATTDDPHRTRAAVLGLAESVLAGTEGDPLVDARVVKGPTTPSDTTPLRQKIAVGAGAVLAIVPGVSLAFLLEGMRPRIRTREDLEEAGVPVALVVRGRKLRKLTAAPAHSRPPDDLIELRSRLNAEGRPVVVTSAVPSDATAVTRLAEALAGHARQAGDPRSGPRGVTVGPVVLARPALLSEASAQAAVSEHRACLLVLSTGVAMDQLQGCLRLLQRMGVEPIGGVFVR